MYRRVSRPTDSGRKAVGDAAASAIGVGRPRVRRDSLGAPRRPAVPSGGGRDRACGSGQQPATTYRRQDGANCLRPEFPVHRYLAQDDVGVVVGRDQARPRLGSSSALADRAVLPVARTTRLQIRTAFTLTSGAVSGITMTALRPSCLAVKATARRAAARVGDDPRDRASGEIRPRSGAADLEGPDRLELLARARPHSGQPGERGTLDQWGGRGHRSKVVGGGGVPPQYSQAAVVTLAEARCPRSGPRCPVVLLDHPCHVHQSPSSRCMT